MWASESNAPCFYHCVCFHLTYEVHSRQAAPQMFVHGWGRVFPSPSAQHPRMPGPSPYASGCAELYLWCCECQRHLDRAAWRCRMGISGHSFHGRRSLSRSQTVGNWIMWMGGVVVGVVQWWSRGQSGWPFIATASLMDTKFGVKRTNVPAPPLAWSQIVRFWEGILTIFLVCMI